MMKLSINPGCAQRKRGWKGSLALCAWLLGLPACAQAQSTDTGTLVNTGVPDAFDRGRNQSVLEHYRPDYQPQGLNVSSFKVYPSLETGGGVSDNVYQTNENRKTDVFGAVKPQLDVRSDWNVHELTFLANTYLRRYTGQTTRDLTLFNVGGQGRFDIGDAGAIYAEARYDRSYETAQTGAVQAVQGAFSTYNRAYFSLRGEYRMGQTRAMLVLDHTGIAFNPVAALSGGVIDQTTRDRVVNRATGQLEYAFTPSVAVYAQGSVAKTDYSRIDPLLGGNRDSTSGRIIGGISLDLAGFLRGKLGVGYVFRDYKLPSLGKLRGVSAEAKLEYFPSELTTFTLAAGRTLEDTSMANVSAYYDTRVSLRVDHELLRNLLLNARGEYIWQDYIGTTLHARNYRAVVGAEYYSSPLLRVYLNGFINHRRDNGTGVASNYYEHGAELGLIWQI